MLNRYNSRGSNCRKLREVITAKLLVKGDNYKRQIKSILDIQICDVFYSNFIFFFFTLLSDDNESKNQKLNTKFTNF